MAKVCVITGGGSGMGFSAAKFVGTDYQLVITGRTVAKLENAKAELEAMGHSVEAVACDVSNRESVKELVKKAASLGEVKAVIHAAGVSPTMGDANYIVDINALGTIYINEEFAAVMQDESCIVDVSSMAAYMMPEDQLPTALYPLALADAASFQNHLHDVLTQVPAEHAPGFAYSVSKNFVMWYAVQSALKYGRKGIRVLSVSPGTFATPMGDAEGEQASSIAEQGALGRVGDPDEIGRLLAFVAVGGANYLTATDILCDGGAVAAIRAAQSAQ